MDTADNSEQSKRKVRLVVLIDPQQREKLDELSTATGATLGELVRRGLNNYFNARPGLSA